MEQAGYELRPLPYEGRRAQCCSWGGQIAIANPPYTRWLAEKRASEGEFPYVTSCANCRDVFAAAGKPVRHILDIVLGLEGWTRRTPGATERRRNREHLKESLGAKYWPDRVGLREGRDGTMEMKRLIVGPELKEKMDGLRLLEEDALAIIEACEATGRRIRDEDTGHFFGYGPVGRMTQWVEYEPCAEGYVLHNTYSHRMAIES